MRRTARVSVVERLVSELGAVSSEASHLAGRAPDADEMKRVDDAINRATEAISKVLCDPSSEDMALLASAWESMARAQDALIKARSTLARAGEQWTAAREQAARARAMRARSHAMRLQQWLHRTRM
jgi:hypothetical protein